MPTLNEITNAAGYVGNAALGGGGGLAIEIDTRPLQQLAQYTFLYHKAQWDQQQKDADEKIKALSQLTAYDAATGEGKDKDEVLNSVEALRKKGADFAAKTWKTPGEKTKAYFQFQKEIAEDVKLINSATARQLKITAYRDKIQADPNITAQEKDLRIKQADRQFNDTDIYTLPTFSQFDLTTPKVGEPVYETIDVIKKDKDGNAIVTEQKKEFSITGNAKLSYLEGNGLLFPTAPPANATQAQKDEYEQKKLAFGKTKLGGWQDASQFFAGALNDPNYKKTITTTGINVVGAPAATTLTDEVDIEKIKVSNPIVGGTISLAERYNKYIDKKIEDTEKGFYIDSITGEEVLFTGGDKVEDLRAAKIDVTKPLSPQSLAQLARFEAAKPDQVEKKFVQTDNAIQKENTRVQWYNAKTSRINALKPEGGSGAKKDDVIDKPAFLFGQHIDRLKNKFKETGGKSIIVTYEALDPKTRIATGVQEGQKITYNADGSFQVSDKADKLVSTGLIENLAQGFIEAVKIIDLNAEGKDAAMAEGFQTKSENKFKELWGTTSGKVIWDNWGTGTTQQNTPSTPNDANYYNNESNVKSESGNEITYKDGTVWVYNSKTGTLTPKK